MTAVRRTITSFWMGWMIKLRGRTHKEEVLTSVSCFMWPCWYLRSRFSWFTAKTALHSSQDGVSKIMSASFWNTFSVLYLNKKPLKPTLFHPASFLEASSIVVGQQICCHQVNHVNTGTLNLIWKCWKGNRTAKRN